jgi:hypothetical protein
MDMFGQTVSEGTVIIENDVSIVFGTTKLLLGDSGTQTRASTLRYTSAYVTRDGEWQLISLHMQPWSRPQPRCLVDAHAFAHRSRAFHL